MKGSAGGCGFLESARRSPSISIPSSCFWLSQAVPAMMFGSDMQGLKMRNFLKQPPTVIQEQIFSQMLARTPQAENLRIASVQHKFLDGSLYTVAFTGKDPEGTERDYINRAYVRKNSIDIYGFDDQLLAIVGATHGSGIGSLFSSPQFMTSVIAFVMTVAVMIWTGVSLFKGIPLEVPNFLTSGFLIILGYYFGKASNPAAE